MSLDNTLQYIVSSVEDAWIACEEKEAQMAPILPETGGRDIGQLGNTIRSIEQGDGSWFYNPQWIPEPAFPEEQGAVAVYKIFRDRNTVSVYPWTSTAAVSVTIDWGDGLTQDVARGLHLHAYDYDTLVSPVTDDGAKTVIVQISPIATNGMDYLRFAHNNGLNYNQLVYCAMNCIGMTAMSQFIGGTISATYMPAQICECVRIKNLPQNANYANCFNGCMSLRVLDTFGEVISANNLNAIVNNTTLLDGSLTIELNATATISVGSLGYALSALDNIVLLGGDGTVSYNSANFITTNYYCTVFDIQNFRYNIIQNISITGSTAGLLHTIRLNWDYFKCASISFTSARLLETLNATGNIQPQVTTLDFSMTSINANVIHDLIPQLYDRTGLSAGTINLQFTLAALDLTAADKALIAAKNWNLVL